MAELAALKKKLQTCQGRQRLAEIYGKPQNETAAEAARLQTLVEGFGGMFPYHAADAVLCTAAGRTEIGGNHTDHERGQVLAASVSLDAVACAAPNGREVVRLYSEDYGMTQISLKDLLPVPAEVNTTQALVRGILARTAQLGYTPVGMDIYMQSAVPGGSGLSSSACFEVLVGVIANRLYCRQELSLTQIAQMGQYAENIYFGKPSGLMDQMACALGGMIAIDFADQKRPQVTRIAFDFTSAQHALCIIDTGADHKDLTDAYAAVPAEMQATARQLGADVLGAVNPEDFYAALPQLRAAVGDRAVLRAMHYFDDVQRVRQQLAALQAGDFDTFLRLVTASGLSSFTYLQNIDTYRDPLRQPVAVALAAAQHLLGGRGAYRVHGGGFAGTIQAFVPLDILASFTEGMEWLLGAGSCRVMSIRPTGGAVIFE